MESILDANWKPKDDVFNNHSFVSYILDKHEHLAKFHVLRVMWTSLGEPADPTTLLFSNCKTVYLFTYMPPRRLASQKLADSPRLRFCRGVLLAFHSLTSAQHEITSTANKRNQWKFVLASAN